MASYLFTVLCLACVAAVAAAPTSIQINKAGLIPESVEYMPARGFIVGSLGGEGIHTVDDDGNVTVLNSLASIGSPRTLGVQLNPRSNLLHVARFTLPPDPSKPRQSGLVTIDLATNMIVQDVDFTGLGNLSQAHFANDMDIDLSGNVFVADSLQAAVYKVTPLGSASVYVQHPLLAGVKSTVNPFGVGADGITFMPNSYGKYFLVGVYGYNTNVLSRIVKISHPSPTTVTEVVLSGDAMHGADGMYPYNGKLYIAGNGGVNELYTLTSTDDWQSATVVKQTASCTTPTAPVARDGNIYVSCANGFNAKLPYFINKMTSLTPTAREVAQEVVAEHLLAMASHNFKKAFMLLSDNLVLQWHGSPLVPDAGVFRGISGFEHFFARAVANFEQVSFSDSRFVGTSDSGLVVLSHVESSVSAASGKAIQNLPTLVLYKVDLAARKIVTIDVFTDSMTIASKVCRGIVICDPLALPIKDTVYPSYTQPAAVSNASLSPEERVNRKLVNDYFHAFDQSVAQRNFDPVLPYLADDVRLSIWASPTYFPLGGTHIGKTAYVNNFALAGAKNFDFFSSSFPTWVAVAGYHVVGTWVENARSPHTMRSTRNVRTVVHYTIGFSHSGNRVIKAIDVFFDSTHYSVINCPGAYVCAPPFAVNLTAALGAAAAAMPPPPAAPAGGTTDCHRGASIGQVVATVVVTGLALTIGALFVMSTALRGAKQRSDTMSANLL